MKAGSSELNDVWVLDDSVQARMVVSAEFGSNRFNDGQVVTASSTKTVTRGISNLKSTTADYWSAEDAFNNKNLNTMKWLVADQGVMLNEEETGDGWRSIDLDDKESEHGWWGATKSNGSGIFTTPEWVQSEFYMPDETTPFGRRVNKFVIYLTEGYGNMKDILPQYKDENGDWITIGSGVYTTASDEYVVEFDIPVENEILVYGLKLTINSSHDPAQFARLSEFNAYYIADISDDIVSSDISESREEYDETTVPVGLFSANTFNLELDNTQGLYSPDNGDSPYAPYIGGNVRFEVKMETIVDGLPELTDMGEFWSDEFNVDGSATTARVTCRDFSKFLQDEQIENGHMWENTTMPVVVRDIFARLGFPSDKIVIDNAGWRGYTTLYLKDSSYWQFMTEIALAEQASFGFEEQGQFHLSPYDALSGNPPPTYTFTWEKNIVDGNIKTILYVNKVKVTSYPTDSIENSFKPIWSPPSPQILKWSAIAGSVGPTATTITVKAAKYQETGNLTANNWYENNGILFLPTFEVALKSNPNSWSQHNGAFETIDLNKYLYRIKSGELIKYASRSDNQFLGCERGFLDTTPGTYSDGQYIGEARYYEMEFDNAPASVVKYPFVTAIDGLELTPEEGRRQAEVVFWENTNFEGKLCIANLVLGLTWIQGSGQTHKDILDENIKSPVEFHTSISGRVITEKAGKEQINGAQTEDPTAENKDYVRRYGKNEIEIDNKWIQSKDHAQFVADTIINEFRNGRQVVEMNIFPNPLLKLGDRVQITNYPQLDIQNTEYHIIGIKYSYTGGLEGSVTLREVKS